MTTGVLTTYKQGRHSFSAHVYAASEEEAAQTVALRGLEETIDSSLSPLAPRPNYHLLSDEAFLAALPDILHHCAFAAWIALKAGTMSLDEVLGDFGVLHELIHLSSGSIDPTPDTLATIKQQVEHLFSSSPGF